MNPTTARHPFPPLPGIADPQADLLMDDPAWRYRSACAAGGGLAHLRVWNTQGQPVRGHLAIVTEARRRPTAPGRSDRARGAVPRAARSARTLGAADGDDHDRLDQVALEGQRPAWRRIWPTPTNPHHADFEAWMQSYGHDLLAAYRQST